MVKFSEKEVKFLEGQEVCRLATSSKSLQPHVVPVCYIFHKGHFYIATDFDTKKLKNLKENRKVSLVVDVYRQPKNKAIFIQGEAEILERGEEFKEISEIFFKKFYWARADPWEEGETVILKIKPEKKISWGI
ncbi:MAG: pyridoxamine 5'-phosphate oxidase family protein [Candidatus Aenigmatarchaeota archaeon]